MPNSDFEVKFKHYSIIDPKLIYFYPKINVTMTFDPLISKSIGR